MAEQTTVEVNEESVAEQATVEVNEESVAEQATVEVNEESFVEQATVEINGESVAEQATVEVVENYKGILIQYCQKRGLPGPIYTETRSGELSKPSWKVTVRYGDWVYEMPEPVQGPKKLAHQIASKRALAEIDSRREKFLAGEETEQKGQSAPTEAYPESEKLRVPMGIVSSALTIANERLVASQPTRYRTIADKEFSRRLAGITLEIIRDLVKKAEKEKITFV